MFKFWLIKFNIIFHTSRVQLSYYSYPADSLFFCSVSTSFSFLSSFPSFLLFPVLGHLSFSWLLNFLFLEEELNI